MWGSVTAWARTALILFFTSLTLQEGKNPQLLFGERKSKERSKADARNVATGYASAWPFPIPYYLKHKSACNFQFPHQRSSLLVWCIYTCASAAIDQGKEGYYIWRLVPIGPWDISIVAENIDKAAAKIIDVLEDTSKGNVIYYSGFCGLGASEALKVVAQRLKSSKSMFDKVIHVDCSVWKSMRALQKAVAKELELPQSVMAIFDRCDEDDDFNAVDEGSRRVIADIGREIYEKLAYSRFVVIFHNGSRRYIDLYECGVPAIPFLRNKVLWTWHGRFRLDMVLDDRELELMLDDGEQEKMRMQTNVYLRRNLEDGEVLQDLVHQEAEEIANCIRIAGPYYMNHKVVKQCVFYGWVLRNIISPTGVYLDTRGLNYWVCDGIIRGQGHTSAWEIGSSLQRNMHLDWVWKNPEGTVYLAALLMTDNDVDHDRWVLFTHKKLLQDDNSAVPPGATSFFVLPDESPMNAIPVLPVSMFQHSHNNKLQVLYLSRCTFSFASPPFLCCRQLKLLHLDHCTSITDDDEYQRHNENISCFQKLWVLDLRYTDWYWLLSEKVKRLMVELRELNVEGFKHGGIRDLCGGRPSLVILPSDSSFSSYRERRQK